MLRSSLRDAVRVAMFECVSNKLHSVLSPEVLVSIRWGLQTAIRKAFLEVLGVELSEPTLEELRVEQDSVSPSHLNVIVPWSIRQWMTDP